MIEHETRVRFAEAASAYRIAQEWGEWKDVYPLIETLRPKHVLELGSYFGGWLYAVAPACADGAVLLSIDNNGEPHRLQRMLQLCGKLQEEGKTFRFHVGDTRSQPILDAVRREMPEIDLLHIDGDHEYAACREDFLNYSALVRQHGMIIFHDIHGEAGVKRLWHEIKPFNPGAAEFFCKRERPLMGTGVIRL